MLIVTLLKKYRLLNKIFYVGLEYRKQKKLLGYHYFYHYFMEDK